MQCAHQKSWQTCGLSLAALLLSACSTDPDQGSIWPPADFEVTVEESSIGGDEIRIVRRFRARADGLATFATAIDEIVDPETRTPLTVWSRLSVYRLVPTCTRALARRVHLAGILELEPVQGQREGDATIGAALRWQAFDRCVEITSRGRVHGPMAEILAIVAAHLPEGEQLSTPGVADRGIAPVLRGVPAPREDLEGALGAHLALLESGDDPITLRDAFALACRAGRRPLAEELLGRWTAAVSVAEAPVVEEAPTGDVRLTPEILARMLPPASQ